ncbi:hypothetical protein [Sporocytophaga myxococcoides]|uniref:hypothetical protein n=1 Tax=Sporocytophaga myxococcoides TaxID=153721 RepID=UPI000423F39D|nr:hypothetical protein [Sporocytophaga myxococcoides]
MNNNDFRSYFEKNNENQGTKPINIYEFTHRFYKETATFYDIEMGALVSNILIEWMEKYKKAISQDKIKRIQERGY